MKEVDAQTYVEVEVTCPYCSCWQDIFDHPNIKESMGFDLRSKDANIEVTCDDCGKIFLVKDILY